MIQQGKQQVCNKKILKMKNKTTLFALVISTSLWAQPQIDLRNFLPYFTFPDYESSMVYGKVKSIKETSFEASDVWGKIEKGDRYNRFDINEKEDYRKDFYLELDKKGRLIKRIVSYYDPQSVHKDEYSEIWEMIYHKNTRTVCHIEKENDSVKSSSKWVTKYVNSKQSQPVEEFYYKPYDTLKEKRIFKLEKNGNCQEIVYDKEENWLRTDYHDKHWNRMKAEYADGRVINYFNPTNNTFELTLFAGVAITSEPPVYAKTIFISKYLEKHKLKVILEQRYVNDKLERERYYTYDNKRNLIEKKEITVENIETENITYKYNKQNLLTEKEIYQNGKLEEKTINIYNEKGSIISMETIDNKLVTYKYNNKNLLILKKIYQYKMKNGVYYRDIVDRYIFEYEYDKKGNWTKMIINGSYAWDYFLIEREITYF
jgi:hypothetical protein